MHVMLFIVVSLLIMLCLQWPVQQFVQMRPARTNNPTNEAKHIRHLLKTYFVGLESLCDKNSLFNVLISSCTSIIWTQ